jgi:hypothetical protein
LHPLRIPAPRYSTTGNPVVALFAVRSRSVRDHPQPQLTAANLVQENLIRRIATMNKNGLVVLVHLSGAAEEVTVIVAPKGFVGAMKVPMPKPYRRWRNALSPACMVFRTLSGFATAALMHGAEAIRWTEVLNLLTS